MGKANTEQTEVFPGEITDGKLSAMEARASQLGNGPRTPRRVLWVLGPKSVLLQNTNDCSAEVAPWRAVLPEPYFRVSIFDAETHFTKRSSPVSFSTSSRSCRWEVRAILISRMSLVSEAPYHYDYNILIRSFFRNYRKHAAW